MGRENAKNIQKTKIVIVLGGEFPPLKALKKTLIIVAAASDQANTVAAEPAST